MSHEKEIAKLKQDILTRDNQIKTLNAQVQGSQQMINENQQVVLNLRTNLILFQQQLQTTGQTNASLKQQNEALNVDKQNLTDNVAILQQQIEALQISIPLAQEAVNPESNDVPDSAPESNDQAA